MNHKAKPDSDGLSNKDNNNENNTGLKGSPLSSSKLDIEVTLVDPKDRFVFLPLLYELAVGSATVDEVAPSYAQLLKNTIVKHKQCRVKNFDANSGTVHFEEDSDNNGEDIAETFDQIIVAVGVQPRVDIVPGAREFSIPFHRVEDAFRLKNVMRAHMTGDKEIIRAAVIGGGYSGVEVATNMAEFIGKDRAVVSIIDRNDMILHTSPAHNRIAAERALISNGVSIICNTSVVGITESGVQLRPKSGEQFELPADIVVSTLGVQASKFVEGITDLPKDASGRLITTRSLLCKGSVNVFALGDCSCIEGEPVPFTAQAAIQQAEIAARNSFKIAQMKSNMDPLSTGESASIQVDQLSLANFRFIDLGQMLTLGKKDASMYSLGGLVELDGPVAAAARRVVYAARMPTNEQKVKALVSAGASTAVNILSSFIKKL